MLNNNHDIPSMDSYDNFANVLICFLWALQYFFSFVIFS